MSIAFPSWLERYFGSHPVEIESLRQELAASPGKDALRPTDDIERLLDSPAYQFGRFLLKKSTPLALFAIRIIRRIRRLGFSQTAKRKTRVPK